MLNYIRESLHDKERPCRQKIYAKLREILFRENIVAWFVSVGRLNNNVFLHRASQMFIKENTVQYVTLIHYFAHILEDYSKIEKDSDGIILFLTSLGP